MTAQVQYHLGAEAGEPLPLVLDRLSQHAAWSPFDARACAFVAALSQRMLADRDTRRFPEMMAMAYWFRRARLTELAKRYPEDDGEAIVRGRGISFHLAPANVDTVFMYSMLLALLAGNTAVVRVSQRGGETFERLIDHLRNLLQHESGQAMQGRLVLLTYPHDSTITGALSARCTTRVVWGGDTTVAAVRAIPLSPTANELCFPDRFSLAVMDAATVATCTQEALTTLVARFHNDAFWFAQQACSSPRALYWVGEEAVCASAKQRFWQALAQEALAKADPADAAAGSMSRLNAVFQLAAAGLARPAEPITNAWAAPVVLQPELPTVTPAMREAHGGHGLFFERRLSALGDLAAYLTDKEQTVVVHGFQRAALVNLARQLPNRAVDRFAPVGEALAFEPVWDGVDLITAFTRRITLGRFA
jgi:hypothetical protein